MWHLHSEINAEYLKVACASPLYLLFMFFVRYQLLSLAWGVAIVHIYSGRLLLVFVAPVSKIFVLAQEKKPLMARPNWELLVLLVLQLLLVLLCRFVWHPSTFPHCTTVTIGGPGTGWRSRVSFFSLLLVAFVFAFNCCIKNTPGTHGLVTLFIAPTIHLLSLCFLSCPVKTLTVCGRARKLRYFMLATTAWGMNVLRAEVAFMEYVGSRS